MNSIQFATSIHTSAKGEDDISIRITVNDPQDLLIIAPVVAKIHRTIFCTTEYQNEFSDSNVVIVEDDAGADDIVKFVIHTLNSLQTPVQYTISFNLQESL